MPEIAKLDPDTRQAQSGPPQHDRTDPAALVSLLDEWMQGDEAEQRATFSIPTWGSRQRSPRGIQALLVSAIVVLDAGPLGMITNPRSSPENEECKDWLAALVSRGTRVVVPEIAAYEVRRELPRADKTKGWLG